MNRKYSLKNRKRFYAFVMLITISLSCVLFAVTVNGADTNNEYITVTVKKGDTLWELARDYSKGSDIRRYIYKIEKANNMTDCNIYEGDILKLPA